MIDVLVVGGGIVGLAHAIEAVRRGMSVLVVERHERAEGASTRKFGMIWPLGQAPGADTERALRSRRIWLDLSREAGFWCRESGAVVVAREEDELAILEEIAAGQGARLGCELLNADDARSRCPGLRCAGLLGALWSPNELAIDPREALPSLAAWVTRHPSAEIRFGEGVVAVEDGAAITAGGERLTARRIFICTGADTRELFPHVYAAASVTPCTLQMMRTAPQPGGWQLGPHVASGLALRHYASFAGCPSVSALRERIRRDRPEFDEFGIHVLIAQNHLGELVVGDSHVYGAAASAPPSPEIDRLILDYARELIDAPTLEPAAKWTGTYLKRMDGETFLTAEPAPNVRIVNALGGAGMTLSFAIAIEQLDAAGLG